MDATAQLALMTKAKIVFERPGTFLSFPALAPMPFSPAALDFGKALSDPKVSAALVEFSRAVNQCPSGVIFQGDSDQYLWEHYDHWLNAMSLAQDELSPDQDAAYTQARALVTAQDANGLVIDSPALSNYKEWRDKYMAAVQAYKSAQTTASMAQDAAAKTQWQNTDEPRLRAVVAAAMADWETKGTKTAIDAAQAKVAACEARMPSKVQLEWRSAYNPDLDHFTDPTTNATCGPSGFAPANICDQPWTTFTLSADEIRGLTAQASKELQNIFGDTGASGISSISFEFCSAAVVRTWFKSAVFDARFWKFVDGEPDLSDGGAPAKGAWPAYVSAVVFARNIRVTTVSAPQAPPTPIRTLPPVMLRPEVLQTLAVRQPTAVVHPQVMMMARPLTAAPVAARVAMPASVVQRPSLVTRTPSPPPRPITVNPALRLNAAIYRVPSAARTPIVVPPAPAPTPPAPAPAPTTPAPTTPAPAPAPDDQVSVLAFICRPLPKVPNPDPALHW
jgi:hypothetical protein